MVYALQQVLNAVPIAALYALLAFGYAIAFAITKRPDITYGALFAGSGHLFLLLAHMGWNPLFLTFPASVAFGITGALAAVTAGGVLIGRGIVAPLAARSPNALTVAALGLLLVLMEAARLASGTRELWLPPFLNAPMTLYAQPGGAVTMTVLQALNAALMALVVMVGGAFLHYARWGRSWRAVSQDTRAAALCGVDAARTCAVAYGLASFCAAIAGILATAYYGTMDFGAGLVFGLKVVLIASVGGHGHPLKAAGGAAVVGICETLFGAYGPVAWRDAVILGALVVVLVSRRRESLLP